MAPDELFDQFTRTPILAQLATKKPDGSLWVCTVYFVKDDDNLFYWHSAKSREHSKHILENSEAAMTIVFDDKAKRAVQMSGMASVVPIEDLPRVHDLYDAKLSSEIGKNEKRLTEALEDTIDGRAYFVFTPKTVHIWDELEYPDSPKQEVNL